MFCTSCAAPMTQTQIACPACGVPPYAESKHCSHCGAATSALQAVCVKCGAPTRLTQKNQKTAALLAIFLGGFGVHKFYLGSWGWGILYLLFCWSYVPMFLGLGEGGMLWRMAPSLFERRYNREPARAFKW